MWQTLIVLIVVGLVSVYIVRHYLKAFRGGAAPCSCCSESCPMASASAPAVAPRSCDHVDETAGDKPASPQVDCPHCGGEAGAGS